MDSQAVAQRRRIAIVDGDRRYDLALPGSVSVQAVLESLGVSGGADRQRMLVDGAGREVSSSVLVTELVDGVVLTVVDPDEALPASARAVQRPMHADRAMTAAWWMLGAAGLLLSVVALLAPDSIAPSWRTPLATAAGVGAVVSATVWALRTRTDDPRGVAAATGTLALAFAAGVIAVPPLPVSAVVLAVFCGLASAAVLAGLLSLLARADAVRAQLGTATLILLALTAVWGVALVLGLPVAAPAAVALGAVPVALRALPSTLLDVPPGMFLDYRRFQQTRWAVRQRLPDEGEPIGERAARGLIDRSSGRLLVGTAMLTAIAAVSAWVALPDFAGTDPVVLAGRIAVAACVTLALLLGARRASAPLLRWMPRAAAVVVAAAAVLCATRAAGALALTVGAGLLLAAGVAVAFSVVPVARGARSLAWSRFGDLVEWIAVVLSLPAGLLAADVIDLLRGMMGG